MSILLRAALASLWSEVPLLLLGLGCAVVGLVATRLTPLSAGLHLDALSTYLVVLPMPLPILLLVGRLGVRDATGRFLPGYAGWRRAWSTFRQQYCNTGRVVRALGALMGMALVFTGFAAAKKAIPALNPYRWDAALADLDKTLHFGRHPWEWLQPVIGHAWLTQLLDVAYLAWPPVLTVVLAWQAWEGTPGPRLQFFLSVAGVWILLGGLLATLLSSGGPCYFARLVDGDDPYQGLLSYLAQAGGSTPLTAIRGQAGLWERYELGNKQLYDGISAMPSVHVAMSTLFVLLGRRYSRWLGWVFLGYLGIILIGSVHLGWHYAVDGYLAIVGAAAIWAGAGYVARRIEDREGAERGSGGPALPSG